MKTAKSVVVLITVYNDGRFLDESLASAIEVVDATTSATVRVVIADDGSTERRTVDVLNRCTRRGFEVVRLAHRGLAATRNCAIRMTDADWFIPLDADNRLRSTAIEVLLALASRSDATALAYGDAMFFGNRHGRWVMGPTDRNRLRLYNHIDNCGLVRRTAWERVGGYDTNLLGYEDWGLWTKLLSDGWNLDYVPELTFDYRVRPDSLIWQRQRLMYSAMATPVSPAR